MDSSKKSKCGSTNVTIAEASTIRVTHDNSIYNIIHIDILPNKKKRKKKKKRKRVLGDVTIWKVIVHDYEIMIKLVPNFVLFKKPIILPLELL